MSVLLRAHDEPVVSRVDYWRHAVETTLAPMDLRINDGPDFRSRIRAGDAGPVRVAELAVPSAQLFRSSKLVRQSDPDMCKIDVQVSGQMVVGQDGRQAALRPGDFTLVDLSRPCQWANTPGMVIAIAFPRATLPLRSNDAASLTAVRVHGHDGVSGLVSSLARQLVKRIDDADSARLGTALVDLLTVTLADRLDRSDEVPAESRSRTLLLRIQAFIEERLGDPELSPQAIADAHHISVRYLYNLFETQDETVSAWIRRRRLEHCRRELHDPASRHDLVSAVGARWGFLSADHFSRAFRTEFGRSPREYRRMAAPESATSTPRDGGRGRSRA
jgi:AraC-like DNA-binding protein